MKGVSVFFCLCLEKTDWEQIVFGPEVRCLLSVNNNLVKHIYCTASTDGQRQTGGGRQGFSVAL